MSDFEPRLTEDADQNFHSTIIKETELNLKTIQVNKSGLRLPITQEQEFFEDNSISLKNAKKIAKQNKIPRYGKNDYS